MLVRVGSVPSGEGSTGMQTHQVEGGSLRFEVRGQGDPLLLIHGACGQIEMLADCATELTATHRVLSYDRRGYGSSTPRATNDVRVHANDAAQLVRDVLEEPAIVVGWSWGGDIAMALALAEPSLVRSLVLLEPAFHMGRPTAEGLGLVGKVGYQYLRGEDRLAAETVGRWVFQRQSGGTAWDEMPENIQDIWLGNTSALKVELLRPSLHNLSMDWVSTKTISGIAAPVTFLLGDDSHAMRHRVHERLSTALPAMTTVRVPGASHLLPVESPAAVRDALLEATADHA
jgi:pimeloyl-ACP methyl ester carboxylesterase